MNKDIALKPFEEPYFLSLKSAISSHNLHSGEIILEISYIVEPTSRVNDLLFSFFEQYNIKTEETDYFNVRLDFEEHKVTKSQAIESIRYGLRTKVNYTVIDKAFSDKETLKYAHGVIELFREPTYYKYPSRLWQKELNLNDFWETGGVIFVDKEKIGIFWINDLYDKFD